MRFLTDENLPRQVVHVLRQLGHNVEDVRELRMDGAPDGTVSGYARSKGRILVTMDMDFANILQYPPARYAGIVVLRVPRPTGPRVANTLRNFLTVANEEDIVRALVIVEPGRYRIRRS